MVGSVTTEDARTIMCIIFIMWVFLNLYKMVVKMIKLAGDSSAVCSHTWSHQLLLRPNEALADQCSPVLFLKETVNK